MWYITSNLLLPPKISKFNASHNRMVKTKERISFCISFVQNVLEMTVFWDIVPCNLVETDRRFGGAYCLHHHGDDVLNQWWESPFKSCQWEHCSLSFTDSVKSYITTFKRIRHILILVVFFTSFGIAYTFFNLGLYTIYTEKCLHYVRKNFGLDWIHVA
jgi:hypothetical protein